MLQICKRIENDLGTGIWLAEQCFRDLDPTNDGQPTAPEYSRTSDEQFAALTAKLRILRHTTQFITHPFQALVPLGDLKGYLRRPEDFNNILEICFRKLIDAISYFQSPPSDFEEYLHHSKESRKVSEICWRKLMDAIIYFHTPFSEFEQYLCHPDDSGKVSKYA